MLWWYVYLRHIKHSLKAMLCSIHYRENKRLQKWHRFKVFWLIPLGLFKCLGKGGGEVKAKIERRKILVPLVITMFPMVWNAKSEYFFYYKDINLSHCKVISIYNAHVRKSWLLCHSLETCRDLGYCIVLNYSQSIHNL